jgi:DNA-binding transcriptional MerR regulator
MQRHAKNATRANRRSEDTASAMLTIGDAARLSGCTPEAIRYYEREGVVPSPTRAGSGRYRHYRRGDIDRLRFLRRARELGFSLAEVRNLLALAEGERTRKCSEVDRLAKAHLATMESKLAQLGTLRDRLTTLIGRCRGGFAVSDCRILGALGDE